MNAFYMIRPFEKKKKQAKTPEEIKLLQDRKFANTKENQQKNSTE